MGYRLMLDVAQHCLLYSGRSNKSVSYWRGKAPRPTLRILIFKTPLVCTSIAGDRSSSTLQREKFGGESATAWRKTWAIWRESNDRVTNGNKIAIDGRTDEIRNEICLQSNPSSGIWVRYSLRQTIYFAVLFVRTIIACRYFYLDGCFFLSITASVWFLGGKVRQRGAILGCRQFPRHFMLRSYTWNVSQVSRRVLLPANIDETTMQLSRRLPAMTYFYSDDDLRRQCRFHLRFLFHRWRAQAAEVSVSHRVSVRVADDSIHFPTSPAHAS